MYARLHHPTDYRHNHRIIKDLDSHRLHPRFQYPDGLLPMPCAVVSGVGRVLYVAYLLAAASPAYALFFSRALTFWTCKQTMVPR